MATNTAPSDRTTVTRLRERGVYERGVIDAILDEALICHVGFVVEGRPRVLPTIHARVGDTVYIHGSVASHMLRSLADGAEACLVATIIDGLVLARSAFHHSMNYRSVVVFGAARAVTDLEEREAALSAIVEHVAPGRMAEVRAPSPRELAQTLVLALCLDEASAKVRTGPPLDDEDDLTLPMWAGTVPLSINVGAPLSDPLLPAGVAPGPSVTSWRRPPQPTT